MSIYVQKSRLIIEEVKKAVVGKNECVEKVMMTMLAGGHILLEDIPGVGKTTMALAFSRAMDLLWKRVQFTPDVLPADITGFSMYQKVTGQFTYQPGAVMSNLFLADEINRTSPKTQSALLEVMEEGNVTVEGVTREVPKPFIVIATQNPVGSAGTQMLPESQLDRFMVCMTIGYPDVEDEIALLKDRGTGNPIDQITPVIKGQDLIQMQKETDQVFIHDVIYNYVAKLVAATREHPFLELGVSPRGTIALTRMAKACAYLNERNYVTPNDVCSVILDVMCHRVKLNAKARVNHVTSTAVIEEILGKVPKPTPRRK